MSHGEAIAVVRRRSHQLIGTERHAPYAAPNACGDVEAASPQAFDAA